MLKQLNKYVIIYTYIYITKDGPRMKHQTNMDENTKLQFHSQTIKSHAVFNEIIHSDLKSLTSLSTANITVPKKKNTIQWA